MVILLSNENDDYDLKKQLNLLNLFLYALKLAIQVKKKDFYLIQVRDMVGVGLFCLLVAKVKSAIYL